MDKELQEIIADLMRHRPQTSRDLYCRGYWDGAMMMLAYYDPHLFHKMWPEWVRQKKMLAPEKPKES